jgi:superoxide dismutase, Fe-Mn family
MNRIDFLKTIFVGVGSAYFSPAQASSNNEPFADAFTLPKLNFEYKDLEPHIDAATMEIHHSKHHQAYVTNLNKAIAGTSAEGQSLEALMAGISKHSSAIRNNGGGHWNHSFFWQILSPKTSLPSAKMLSLINQNFGIFEKFQADFAAAATTRFGSGWAWVVLQEGKLKICSTPNQDNPLMDIAETKGKPILAIDVWEHAYYLKYQNKRADYIKAFWNVVDWQAVESKLGA